MVSPASKFGTALGTSRMLTICFLAYADLTNGIAFCMA
jgi:hypothetical protein